MRDERDMQRRMTGATHDELSKAVEVVDRVLKGLLASAATIMTVTAAMRAR